MTLSVEVGLCDSTQCAWLSCAVSTRTETQRDLSKSDRRLAQTIWSALYLTKQRYQLYAT